jgi:preprotein translocase, SecY subunit
VLQTLKNAWKITELRYKLLFTIFIVVLYRIGSVIPVPYINAELLQQQFSATGSIFEYFNLLSGDAFSRATLFALSISPYITSSIVIQLLTIAIPYLERLAKEGEEGRRVLTQITRYVTVALSLISSYGYYTFLRANNFLTDTGVFQAVVIIACYSAGAAVIMWLAERINESGIGNGISIILLANIVANFPSMIFGAVKNATLKQGAMKFIFPVIILLVFVFMVGYVVFITNSERRLAIQYAKRQVGRKMYGGQSTNLPIRLSMSGVMPIIFANSIVALPTTIALMFPPKAGTVWSKITNLFSSSSPIYMIMFFLLIIAFSYFYLTISFNPIEVANNLKKNGGFIPGIRPGKPTSDYITKILNRITLIGAVAIGIIAVLPLSLGMINTAMRGLAFGGSSIIIVVGVIAETAKEIQAQMTMRHYKGFLE